MVKKKPVKKPVRKPRKIAAKKTVAKKAPRKSRKLAQPIRLAKSKRNPILLPDKRNTWESWQTFNPGVVLLENKVYFLYRAIGDDGISRFGYAVSGDGFSIDERLSYPVYEHAIGGKTSRSAISQPKTYAIYSYLSGGSWGGAEDPRITRVGNEDVLYVTYTACDNGLRVGLTSIKVSDFLNKKWNWKSPVLISPPGEVHKNWLIFPEKLHGKYAVLHSIKPNIQVEYLDDLNFNNAEQIKSFSCQGPQKGCWDKWLRGAGAPPLKTKYGWLLFYHAMDDDWSKYKVGAMLLDSEDPTKILYRAKDPVLEPSEYYENTGYKGGVVYVSGAIIKNGKLLVYYGASDSYVGVAYAKLDEFLEALVKGNKPQLQFKPIEKK